MNVLILGSGGREHTLAWKIAQSQKLNKLYIAPGNAGTKDVGTNLDIAADNFPALKQKVLELDINMIIVGPEDPLVKGIRNFFDDDNELKNVSVIGPDKVGAELEGSKEFAKEFMFRHNIPTAAYESFTLASLEKGYTFLESLTAPYVLKADGLAAGKGVLILEDLQEAKDALKTMLEGQFGAASDKVVIEEFLDGIEVSYFVLSDGENYKLFPEAKDYKRIGENNTGLNTGGMGAVSPVPFADEVFKQKVIDRIIDPTIQGLKADKIHYQGFIFFGLIEVGMEPFVIEYNVRMGDPETEVVVPRIKSDLLDMFAAVPNQKLNEVPCEIIEDTATTIMLVSGGYPGNYEKGKTMTGFDNVKESLMFHAGTTDKGNNIVTNGGRVIALTSIADNKENALKKSYKSANAIQFDGKYFRNDIGFDI